MESNEIGTDVSEILDTQGDLSRRISRIEESVSLGRDNDSLRRINRLEESVGQGQANEHLREYQAKVDQCVASVERLTNRLRMKGWYHELSDQESEDGIDRMVGVSEISHALLHHDVVSIEQGSAHLKSSI